jgi:hypothetical protein
LQPAQTEAKPSLWARFYRNDLVWSRNMMALVSARKF